MSDDAREAIFARMRRDLGRQDGAADEAKARVAARLASPSPTLVPARGDLDPPGRIALFAEKARAVQATVERLDLPDDLPASIARYLRSQNLPLRLVKAEDPPLDGADWAASMIETRTGAALEEDQVGLTTAFAGIAETGTLLVASASTRPTTIAFLPETSIIVVPAGRVLRAYEDAIHLLRATEGDLPRSVNLITGPSRSGDIEQTLQLGAHGPRRLHVLIVGEVPILSPGVQDFESEKSGAEAKASKARRAGDS